MAHNIVAIYMHDMDQNSDNIYCCLCATCNVLCFDSGGNGNSYSRDQLRLSKLKSILCYRNNIRSSVQCFQELM